MSDAAGISPGRVQGKGGVLSSLVLLL